MQRRLWTFSSNAEMATFLIDQTIDPRDFDDACPESASRVLEVNAALTKANKATLTTPSAAEIKDHNIIVQPAAVDTELGRLLTSLSHIFGECDWFEELVETAEGDGLELDALLREKAEEATQGDRAIVNTTFAGIVRDGVQTELTVSSFDAYLKVYNAAKDNLSEAAATAATNNEVEMIGGIAFEDPAIFAAPAWKDVRARVAAEVLFAPAQQLRSAFVAKSS